MKFLIIALALLGAIAALPSLDLNQASENGELQGFITNLINKTINDFISKLDEPLTLDDIKIQDNSELLSGTIAITDISISGLKSLVATNIDLDLGTLALNITIDLPDLNPQFNANLNVVVAELIPLYGSGKDSIDFTGIDVTVTGKADISDLSHIKVENLEVLVKLGTATFNLNGLLNNSELTALVNTVLNDNAASFVNQNSILISKILGQILEEIINGSTGIN